jgi:hypothetical protein
LFGLKFLLCKSMENYLNCIELRSIFLGYQYAEIHSKL